MGVFEYLSVFVSIVVGLAVANVLLGLARMLSDSKARLSFDHLAWVAMVLLLLTFFWWFNFQWDQREVWTFALFLWVVCYSMLVFFASALVIPSDPGEDADWGDAFFQRRTLFFVTWGAGAFADIVDALIRRGGGLYGSDLLLFGPQLVGVGIAIILATTDSRRVFRVLTVIHLVLFASSILFTTEALSG